MIEIQQIYNITCDKCGADLYGLRFNSLKQAQERLEKEDWKVDGFNCICPRCAGKYDNFIEIGDIVEVVDVEDEYKELLHKQSEVYNIQQHPCKSEYLYELRNILHYFKREQLKIIKKF